MLPATITSNSLGLVTRRMAAESTSWCTRVMSGFSAPTSAGHLTPDLHGGEHVGLVDAGDVLASALARDLHGQLHDAADLALAVHHGVEATALTVDHVLALGLTEVDAARELAHEDEVHVGEALRLERRGVLEPAEDLHRADVREEAQLLAHGQQAALGAVRGVGVVPLGAAHGAQQDGVRRLARLDRVGRERVARLVDGDAPQQCLAVRELVVERGGHGVEHQAGCADDLGADAVAGEGCDLGLHDSVLREVASDSSHRERGRLYWWRPVRATRRTAVRGYAAHAP
jgi:hypothetical protein